MTLQEILKGQSLNEEQINKIVHKMEQNKIYTTSLENAEIRYGKVQNDLNTMKAAFETEKQTMKTAFEQEKADIQKKADAQLKQARVTAQIVSDYKPKDVNDIMSQIDFEKISIDGDKIVGLTEQVDPIKEAKAYLFESEKAPGASGLTHGEGGSDLSAIRKAFGLADKKE